MNAQSLLVAAMLMASATAFADTAAKAPTIAKELQQAKTYTISSPPTAPLEMAKPALPDLSGYTAQAMEKKIVKTKAGKISIRRMMQEDALKDFIGGDNKMAEWVVRQHGIPQAIFVDDGYMNLKDLLGKVPKQYFSETSPGVFLAKLPIVVGRKGILDIDKNTQELRLSQQAGSFLINDGQLFVRDTKVTGWDEKANGPALFKSAKEFRPFLLAWGGTETYISKTKMASFGYANSKSYGVSISQYTPNMAKVLKRPEPTGWIIDSEFSDMWYGFYCYETTGFVIKGNTYKDNIVYGIDPHDRSHGLIIADNTVYGTKKKHGIIISREVNDSWIFNNRSYENHLSGIVIDRTSINNVIANNETYRNKSDGITIYESGQNLLWGNKAFNNGRHGIRVRNSAEVDLYENLAVANGLLGIYGHIKDLNGTDRDLALDPFDMNLSLTVVGGRLVGNQTGAISVMGPQSVKLYQLDMLMPAKPTGVGMFGALADGKNQILDLMIRQKKAVLVLPADQLAQAQK